MKFFVFLLLAILPIFVDAQTSRYEQAAETPIINTYVPIPSEMFMLMKEMASNPEIRKRIEEQRLLKEQQRQNQFERYVQLGIECLKKKQIANFLDFSHAALQCGYYNSTLYYNMGIAYVILKKKRKGKKWLKKALESGQIEANKALYALKKKYTLSYNWFLY